ncbi:MAG TPA: multidrug effflux MFS transporter [Xanthobacteraceae bacterium]|nr:multidrug effflux MFS transporter [Xanthobacteraceae bacterium]
MSSPALRPGGFGLTALLAFLTSFGPLSVDLFLPSMPAIGRAFDAPESQVQLTISLYLVGYAIGQLLYGPLSDRFGRKPVVLTALAIFCLGSLGAALAHGLEWLILGRIGQALGASGAMIVTRAVVRDFYEGAHAGRQLSVMGMMMGLVPIVAPIIGGLLLVSAGWRAGFAFQFAVGALALLLVWRYLAETHRPSSTSIAAIAASYRTVAMHPVFLANMIVGCFAYSGLFAWIAGSPFVLQGLIGLTPLQFSLCYAVSCAGFMTGGAIATRLVLQFGLDRTAGLGVLALALAGTAAAVSVAVGVALPITLTASMALFLCGMGMALPQVTAGALTPFPHHAGTASSLVGFAQQCSGAIMGIAVGNTLGTSAWPMVAGVAVAGIASLVLWAATRVQRTRPAKPAATA